MPIHGLTTEQQLPVIGTLRKGAEKQGNRPGRELPYFRFVPADPDDNHLTARLYEALGTNEPKQIPFWLPFPDLHACWENWMEEYVKGGLIRRCDGQSIFLERQGDALITPDPNDCKYQDPHPCRCKPSGRLKIIIDELGRDAVVQVVTTSKNDIIHIDGVLKHFWKRAESWGIAPIDLPLVLKRVQRMISVPSKNGGRMRVKKSMISIEANTAFANVLIQRRRNQFFKLGTDMATGEDMMPVLTYSTELERRQLREPEAPEQVQIVEAVDEPVKPEKDEDWRKALKQCQVACTDMGFKGKEGREQRLFVGKKILGRFSELDSFSECNTKELLDITVALERTMAVLKPEDYSPCLNYAVRHNATEVEWNLPEIAVQFNHSVKTS